MRPPDGGLSDWEPFSRVQEHAHHQSRAAVHGHHLIFLRPERALAFVERGRALEYVLKATFLNDELRSSDHNPHNDREHAKKLENVDGKSGHGTPPQTQGPLSRGRRPLL